MAGVLILAIKCFMFRSEVIRQGSEGYKKRDIGRMRANQAYSILRTEKYINKLKTDPGFKDRPGQEGAVEREIQRNKKKLEHIKAVDHWIVADAVDDPLYATQVHEGVHAVYFHHNLGAKWTEEMDRSPAGAFHSRNTPPKIRGSFSQSSALPSPVA